MPRKRKEIVKIIEAANAAHAGFRFIQSGFAGFNPRSLSDELAGGTQSGALSS